MKAINAVFICVIFLSAAPAFCAGESASDVKKPEAASANAREARKHYLEGLKYYQNADYDKAQEEWNSAAKLDPQNADIKEGLFRLARQENENGVREGDKEKKVNTRHESQEANVSADTVLDAPSPGKRGEVIHIPGEQILYLKRGDHVDVLVTFEAEIGPENKRRRELVTATILQNAFVLNVRQAEKPEGTGFVELMFNPIESQFMALSMTRGGSINLVRRAPGDNELQVMEVSSFRKLIR